MLRAPTLRRLIEGLVVVVAFAVLALAAFVAKSGVLAASQLGTADSFAVLGATAVTNTGPTTIFGDLGVGPGSAVTGFPPGTVNGTIHPADAVALQAQSDVTTAYLALAHQTPCTFTSAALGGQTLRKGVYCFASSALLTGTLTLDAEGDSDALFVFQIPTTLTTASNSSVVMINEGSGCNVFWQIGSSATLGTGTQFEGSILALTSITLNTGANILPGRALARNGAVTMDTNNVSIEDCSTGPSPTTPTATSTATSTARRTATPIHHRATATPAATHTLVPPTATSAPPTSVAPAPIATPFGGPGGVPTALPRTGSGPGNDSPRWLPATWLLLAAGGAVAGAGVIRRRTASRAQHKEG